MSPPRPLAAPDSPSASGTTGSWEQAWNEPPWRGVACGRAASRPRRHDQRTASTRIPPALKQ
eukprot:3584045-Alexandrium_andersonii.AAC.1